jgi:hypothetical protein
MATLWFAKGIDTAAYVRAVLGTETRIIFAIGLAQKQADLGV